MANKQTQTATRQQAPPQAGLHQGTQHQPPSQPAKANGTESVEDKRVEYVPLGEAKPIEIKVGMVRSMLCTPTKNGHLPPYGEVIKFMMICQARGLNPWVGDAYLLGYESQKYGDKWSIVVSIQALLKRADIHPSFEGIESGVIVSYSDQITERQGDIVFDGEELVGGWAKVYRKDRKTPFYQRLRLGTYRRDTQIWHSDPAGMICKDAEAAALRQAFPSDVGSLYLESEMTMLLAADDGKAPAKPPTAASQLKDRLGGTYQPSAAETVVGTAPPKSPEGTQTRQEAPGEHDQSHGEPEGQDDVQGQPEATGGGEEGPFGQEEGVPESHGGPGVHF